MAQLPRIPKDLIREYQQLTQEQIAQYQINQSPMQQGMPNNWADALGSALWGMGSGMTQGISQPQVSSIPYPQYQMPMGSPDYSHRIRFNRINEVVEISECQSVILEPLDELRIKVAKWLNN